MVKLEMKRGENHGYPMLYHGHRRKHERWKTL